MCPSTGCTQCDMLLVDGDSSGVPSRPVVCPSTGGTQCDMLSVDGDPVMVFPLGLWCPLYWRYPV